MKRILNSTRDRILSTAEQLFAESGIAATSMRSITSVARVNLAAVNYHFGSKEALEKTSAGVLLTDKSVFVQTLGIIFLKLTNISIPHKMYSNKEKAIQWLNTYIDP